MTIYQVYKKNRLPDQVVIIIMMITCLFLSSCSITQPIQTQTGTSIPTTMSSIPPTASPSATPSPVPGRAVLVASVDTEQYWLKETQSLMDDLCRSSGLILDVRTSLQTTDIKEDWKIVVFMAAPANLDQFIQAAPKVQFVVMVSSDVAPADNLNIIRIYPERQAFLAGYLSVLVAPDWRAAALLPSDAPLGATLQDAYLNGGGYFCGRCPSLYTPIVLFPVVTELPSSSSTTDWQAAANTLLAQKIIYVMYVAPEAASPELLAYLADAKIVLLGSQTPPDNILPRWAATIRQDTSTSLKELWPSLVAGQGKKSASASLKIADINPDYLSPGRQQLAEKVIEDLTSGWINPLSMP